VQTDTDLLVAEADQAGGVDGAVHLDHRPIPGRQRAEARRAGAVGSQPGQFTSPQPRGQGLDPGTISQHVPAIARYQRSDLPG